MSDTIGPGDYVICILGDAEDDIKAGQVVMVTAVVEATRPCGYGEEGKHSCPPSAFLFLGYDPEDDRGWCPACFRPYSGPEQPARRVCEEVPA